MASLYIENSEKWKTLASIDYFTHFVKAWIPFNAWYKNYYPDLKTDREAIDKIKSNSNKFRNRFISLLNDASNDGIFFRTRISELHIELERKHIESKKHRISFESVSIGNNSKKTDRFLKYRLNYEVVRGAKKQKNEITITISDNNGNKKFEHIQLDGYDINDLKCNVDYLKLNNSQQQNILVCYEEINPSKPIINLLTNNTKNCITMGKIHFINDTDKLCKGIIEILYKLRNVLFHGEIIPDRDTNKVYEPAYHILYILIQAL